MCECLLLQRVARMTATNADEQNEWGLITDHVDWVRLGVAVMGRWKILTRAGALGAFILVSAAGIQYSSAQTAAVSSGACPYWIDSATGKRVPTMPASGSALTGGKNTTIMSDPKHASNSNTGQTFNQQPDSSWIDSATGNQVPTMPASGSALTGGTNTTIMSDSKHASNYNTGQTFVLIDCPPPQTSASSGLYLGGELVKNWGWVRSTERLATTDFVTNQFSDHADPVGGGFLIGYKFAPWANSVIVSPFASFDFINAPVNHTFPNGSYLGTTANFMGTAGVKVGPQIGAGVWLYGIAGVSVLNETLNVNFIPVSSSQSAWVAGGTVGVGGAWQPAFLQGYGHPVSLFAEYQHTWWQDANFNRPATSPFFNYTFARQDDVVKFGFTVALGPAAPPVAAPTYPVKALPGR
jgi:hypothetical protein